MRDALVIMIGLILGLAVLALPRPGPRRSTDRRRDKQSFWDELSGCKMDDET